MAYQGRGQGGGGAGRGQKSKGSTRKTEEAVDRRQKNQNVKAVSPRHCVATSVLRNRYFNCQSHKDNVRSTAAEQQQKQKKSNFQSPV